MVNVIKKVVDMGCDESFIPVIKSFKLIVTSYSQEELSDTPCNNWVPVVCDRGVKYAQSSKVRVVKIVWPREF